MVWYFRFEMMYLGENRFLNYFLKKVLCKKYRLILYIYIFLNCYKLDDVQSL